METSNFIIADQDGDPVCVELEREEAAKAAKLDPFKTFLSQPEETGKTGLLG